MNALQGSNSYVSKILVANSKGGSGKSTLVVNMAAFLTSHENSVSIIDHDPQKSALSWLDRRPHYLPKIKGLALHELSGISNTKVWFDAVSDSTRYVIVDTQAGLREQSLERLMSRIDVIVIPVLPSRIDMIATADFISNLLRHNDFREAPKPIAVVANRVNANTIYYKNLKDFLNTLSIEFISTFSNRLLYIDSVNSGRGLFEMESVEPQRVATESKQWNKLKLWIDTRRRDSMEKYASSRFVSSNWR